MARVAPETPLLLGPRKWQSLVAWIGLVASVAVLIGMIWALLADGPHASLLLPAGIALVNLSVVTPILRSGRSRHCLVNTAPAALLR